MIDSAEELDFGIYRIMRIKKQEIENWLNIRLEEIVKEQITSNMSSDYGEKKVRLDEKVNSMRQEGYTTSEIDNDRIVKKLRGELEVMGDAEEMQAEVFSHLNTFSLVIMKKAILSLYADTRKMFMPSLMKERK